jgi:hypothetical protein
VLIYSHSLSLPVFTVRADRVGVLLRDALKFHT